MAIDPEHERAFESEDELALDRSLLPAVAALRWATLAWTVVVVVVDASNDSFAHLWAAVALVAAIYTAGMPTWAWLALAGSVLIGSGIAMERAQIGPIESGRRLVDAVQDHFT